MIYDLLRRALFHLDAEEAHEWTGEQMRHLQQIPILLRAMERIFRPPASAAREVLGMQFRSPVGIAGGFDKNATIMPFLAALGFGFIEVGTVTLKPQPGNPKPRLFRRPAERALVNRMGFNNDGADAIAARLRAWDRDVPVFVNVGKNRDVPLDGAVDAYAECYRRVAPHADAAVLNLSSPNTPGLRDLQRPEHLEALLNAVRSLRVGPVLVKIAPDLDDTQIAEICDTCRNLADGMICTNTTAVEGGGLSGVPLREKSTRVLRKVRERVGAGYPLVGVGGIFTAEDVRMKVAAGADLVQIYTSFVYEGPSIARRLARAFLA
ncbi:MAG TPA: quinone-dependent dihydroorotate dehydrogenase [Thermoanaerobaculia bacterium]|jgi:dihydroorotate dehydrogenase